MEISTKDEPELVREASVVTPEDSIPSNGRSVPSNTMARSPSVGDRLYQQGKETARRKEEAAAAGIVDEHATFSPKLMTRKRDDDGEPRTSPFNRLYSMAKPKTPQLEIDTGVKKSSAFSEQKGADLYNRGVQRMEETKAKSASYASSLTPTFTPRKFSKRSSSPSPQGTPNAWDRLYEEGRQKATSPRPQHASWSSEEQECTFKPDISRSQQKAPSMVMSPVFQRLQEDANVRAQKRFSEWITAKESVTPKKVVASKNGPRIDDLYNIGVRKGIEKRHFSSDKEERDARVKRDEEKELGLCTFQPKTTWPVDEDDDDISEMIPFEIEAPAQGINEEVSQLGNDGQSTIGTNGETIPENPDRMDSCPEHVCVTKSDKDVIGVGADELRNNPTIEFGSI